MATPTSTIASDLPPLPGGPADRERRAESYARRRIMMGRWLPLLMQRLADHFGERRAEMLGRPTLARNLARSVALKVSRLYDTPPDVGHESQDADAGADVVAQTLELVDGAGLWQMGQRHQQHTVLIREGYRGVNVVGPADGRRLHFRNVPVDYIHAEAPPSKPDTPHLVVEARRRRFVTEGRERTDWTWDVYDIRNPDEPMYKVVRACALKDGEDWTAALRKKDGDITEQILGADLSGAAYPFRYADGTPFIPGSLTHAIRTGSLWDSFEWCELIEASLDVAMAWTFWLHCLKDASWPQRWALNARAMGGETLQLSDNVTVERVEPDPTRLLQFQARPGEQVLFGQWQPGSDPERLEMAISSFEQATIASLGLGTADAKRAAGGQSGYAIELDQKAVRRLQRQFAPQFAHSDAELLGKAAALCNRNGLTTGAPESGWQVTYPALDLTQTEREAAKMEIDALAASGVQMSSTAKIQSLRQVTREQALALFKRWREDEQLEAEIEAEIAAVASGQETNGAAAEVSSLVEQAVRRAIESMASGPQEGA